ncbi:MAG: phenylalanine--tRNA ligase subunit beta, partial [Vogesella sp.]|uniref:phenylalanine--tRNA ligase subunit beta n=1 Tax=Vogesella sp. TaxID=1904252 RepID=UPI003F402E54
IFLESAFFQPEAIAGKARALGFGSDSSYRYERGVDFALQTEAIERATALVQEICGGEAGPLTETVGQLPQRSSVTVRTARVARVLGVALAAEQIAAIFTRLGLAFEQNDAGFVVSAPSFRFDIEIEEDLIEEIARVYGYDNIPADAPVAAQTMLPQPEGLRVRSEVRRLLAGRDFQEIVSYAFVEEKWERDFAGNANPVRLINPIASQMSVMRSSLIGGLVDTLAANLNRKHSRVRVFEIARVFHKQADGSVQQPEVVAGLAHGGRVDEQWGSKAERVDFYDIKADVEALLYPRVAEYRKATHPAFHPGRCAEVLLGGAVVGVLGELHPQWVQAYGLTNAPVLFELAVEAVEQVGRVQLAPVSKFQPVRRDLALVVAEDVNAATIQLAMKAAASAFVRELALFDVYRGKGVDEGKKSLAFRIVLQAADRTLVDDEVEQAVAAMLAAAQAAGAVLRA